MFAKTIRDLVFHSRFDKLLAPLYRGNGSILLFHRVIPQEQTSPILGLRGLEISVSFFERVLDFFESQGYAWLSLTQFRSKLLENRLPKKFLCITFDDGYADNFEIVLPILQRRSIPFTVFLTSAFADETMFLWWYALERVLLRCEVIDTSALGLEQIIKLKTLTPQRLDELYLQLSALLRRQMASDSAKVEQWFNSHGVSKDQFRPLLYSWSKIKPLLDSSVLQIGGHTVTHRALSSLSTENAQKEIAENRQNIYEKLAVTPDFFAYPFGDATSCGEREFSLAEKVGYQMAFTTRFGNIMPEHHQHPFCIPRINVSGHITSVAGLERRMNGLTQILQSRGRRLLTD